jgi:hypothetical protein
VNVILDAANFDRGQIMRAGNSADVRPDAFLDLGNDPFFAVLRAEHDVQKY